MVQPGKNPPSPVDDAADEELVPSTSRFLRTYQVVVDVVRGHPLYYALTALG